MVKTVKQKINGKKTYEIQVKGSSLWCYECLTFVWDRADVDCHLRMLQHMMTAHKAKLPCNIVFGEVKGGVYQTYPNGWYEVISKDQFEDEALARQHAMGIIEEREN